MITFSQIGKYGRLGNQLFQMAAVIGTAKKANCEYGFPAQHTASIKLPGLTINPAGYERRQERSFTFDHLWWLDLENKPNLDLFGYFQSERYFDHCKKDVYDAIMTPENLAVRASALSRHNINTEYAYASMHIRRGDYLALPNHYAQLTKTRYYQNAFDILQGTVDKFLIFSDDIDWCKANMNADVCTFINEPDALTALMLMSFCGTHVIANSSFSWWGSWLANAKMTIAPREWFGPAITHNTRDLYRQDMLIM